MRVDLYPELSNVLADVARLLRNRDFFLWRREDEPLPESISLSFKPVVSEKVIERAVNKNACTLCARRLSYKKGQFEEPTITKPYLFLVHNTFLGPRANFYNDAAENTLFEKMIMGVLGFNASDALVREILRCHFATDETGTVEQVRNCETHVRHDIETYHIKGIILFGQAAAFVYRDKNELLALQDKVFTWQNLPTMVCPGPNRLQYMRVKKYPKEQIEAERIKIFETLKIFKEKVIELV
ncbi:MAG TPA: hypothetical protein PLY93_04425 [Turneriella sp.]|nr:hypothetical protein [Turneriella sp.]